MGKRAKQARRGPGRPRGRATYYRIAVRLPRELRELIDWAADDACQELSEWVRQALREGVERQRDGR